MEPMPVFGEGFWPGLAGVTPGLTAGLLDWGCFFCGIGLMEVFLVVFDVRARPPVHLCCEAGDAARRGRLTRK